MFNLRRRAWRSACLTMGACLVLAAHGASAGATPQDWGWLVPFEAPAAPANKLTVHHLPGSTQSFTGLQLHDLKHAVDWFPDKHPPMPAIVSEGHDAANACGFCHLPTGNGRPENSALAGLSADYIKRQVAAFANGSRLTAAPNKLPQQLMAATAKDATAGEIEQAAAFFSQLSYVSYVDVVEATEAGFKAGPYVYALQPGARQSLGERIIEAPVDIERFEERDPHVRFIAYVPPGSIAAGQKLMATGGPAGQPCAVCHGQGLKGGLGPALAGRSPTMIMRQLAAFHEGARTNPEAAPMQAIAAQLDTRMMISLAAYAGTLKP